MYICYGIAVRVGTHRLFNRILEFNGKVSPMEWATAITEAVAYMKNHILEEITLQDAANQAIDKHSRGVFDENYYTEIWISVKKK